MPVLRCCCTAEPVHCLSRHELPSDKALLRLRHYYDAAPEANAGNAAMHLANFALHAVAARSARLQDPRMRSLRSVGHLQVRLSISTSHIQMWMMCTHKWHSQCGGMWGYSPATGPGQPLW